MNVDLMRKIDHHVGVPLCFLSSGFWWLLRKIKPLREQPIIRNLLFVELSEMGSTIIADPAMRKAQKEFTDAELYFVIFKKNKPSLDLLSTIKQENIFVLREDNLFTLGLDVIRFLIWCRKNRIDTVVDLELFSRVSALLTGYSGAVRTVGYHNFHGEGLYRGNMLTHKVAYNPHMHMAKNFVALVNALSAPQDEVPYSKTKILDSDIKLAQLSYSDDEQASMHDHVKRLYADYDPQKHKIILINPNASELLPQRRWDLRNYIDLMNMLVKEYDDVIIAITGAPAEKQDAEHLKHQVKSDRCINFAGQLKLLEMPLLYTISSLMVTNDSGPGHFSSITPLKTFVLFGPETPRLYGSLGNSTPIYAGLACSPCVSAANHRKTPCSDPVCMQAIKPQHVFNSVAKALEIQAA